MPPETPQADATDVKAPILKEALLIANLTEIAAEHRASGSLYQAACMELSLNLLEARAAKIERLSSELQAAKEALSCNQKRVHTWLHHYERGLGFISIPTHQLEHLDELNRAALSKATCAQDQGGDRG